MNRYLSQRFLRPAFLLRYYLLVVLFVLIALIVTSIARAIQTNEEADKNSPILSGVFDSYKKIQRSSEEAARLKQQEAFQGLPLILGSIKHLLYLQEDESSSVPLTDASTQISEKTNAEIAEVITETLHDDITLLIGQHESQSNDKDDDARKIADTVIDSMIDTQDINPAQEIIATDITLTAQSEGSQEVDTDIETEAIIELVSEANEKLDEEIDNETVKKATLAISNDISLDPSISNTLETHHSLNSQTEMGQSTHSFNDTLSATQASQSILLTQEAANIVSSLEGALTIPNESTDPNANREIAGLSPEIALKIEKEAGDFINNYLLFTLFPHRKTEIVEEPIVRPYKDQTHSEDLSMMKMAGKINASLSISESSLLEDDAAEEYFDQYYQLYSDSDIEPYQDDANDSDSQAYPYAQGPIEIIEEESTFLNFDELPISKQIEQLLTTGDYYLLTNDPIKARQYYVQAIKRGANDKNSPFYAKALVKLADLEENAYLARFQYTNALDIYESYQDFDLEIADILVKLVWTFDMASERIVIYELLTRAKKIHEAHPYTPKYSEVLRNLAIYYETVEDFDRADAHYKAALALDLQHLSAEDIRVVLALENYAAFYLKFNQLEKAEEVLLFKLEAHEAVSPPDYYNLGRTQSMLGWTYLQMMNLDEALHYYNSALGNINYSITKNRFMPHYYSLPAALDLINFFIYTNEPERAVPYFYVVRALLESEDEAHILDELLATKFEEIDPEQVPNYAWAAKAEIKSLVSIMEYIQTTQMPEEP